MNALKDEKVGDYLNEHFVASYQKVGTFTVVNGQKQGGNVASYFCLADGSVLHAVPGPVDAKTLLREARWAADLRKMAVTESRGNLERYKATVRKGHADRLRNEHGLHQRHLRMNDRASEADVAGMLQHCQSQGMSQTGQVHALLASLPLVKIEQAYKPVFEQVLGEKVSTLPVVVR